MWFVDENKSSKTFKGRNYATFLVCGVLVVSSSFLTALRSVRTGPAVAQELKRTNQSSTPIVPPTITKVDQEDSFKSSNRTSLNATAVSNKVHGNTNRLEFIHITKTGGSAIEAAASHQANIPWGSCHYHCRIPRCPPYCTARNHWALKTTAPNTPIANRSYRAEPWHAPPHWHEPNPLKGADTFVVVRNPYDRIISEYNCFFYGYKGPNHDDLDVFNKWIEAKVNLITRQIRGHMLPQHYYVYDANGTQIVDHILRYENLVEEFDNLMREYGIPITMLPKTNETVRHTYSDKASEAIRIFKARDLSAANIKLINRVYGLDFEYFGYPKMLA